MRTLNSKTKQTIKYLCIKAMNLSKQNLKLFKQVHNVMRLKYYSIQTERSCCQWINRSLHFHHIISLMAKQRISRRLELIALANHNVSSLQKATEAIFADPLQI